MEQLYLIEIFLDKVTIFESEENEHSNSKKKLIFKIKFGPKVQFIIKEEQLAHNKVEYDYKDEKHDEVEYDYIDEKNDKVEYDTKDGKDNIIEYDENRRRKWTRTIRVGKSYLFPSYPDTVLMILSKFPLEIEVWNDDEKEVEIFVGIGTKHWDTQFFHMLKDTADACKIHEPLTVKQNTPLMAECCCKQVGEISFILRLSALGDSIITEFQQLKKDPETFVFRTNKAPSMFSCKRVEGDNPNFCMVGSLYETTTLEDPTVLSAAQQKFEICTEFRSCPHRVHEENGPKTKKCPIDEIRIGDITGQCGNKNCPLAHKVRTYIRSLEPCKKAHNVQDVQSKEEKTTCECKNKTCGSKTNITNETVGYVFSFTKFSDFKESVYGRNYIVKNVMPTFYSPDRQNAIPSSTKGGCYCQKTGCSSTQAKNSIQATSTQSQNVLTQNYDNQALYNKDVIETKRKISVYNCFQLLDDKDCRCNPPKPFPPCKAFDCDCITETASIAARKMHKPYCPSYKHKNNCPVTMLQEEDLEKKSAEDDENETEPLPYGLPPIRLRPCPVLGRPCSVPDGFARMYKNAALPPLPPSYSNAGKVSCSKQFERIKTAIKDYMKYEKDYDYRCVNKFNVDTERRCCDKEQKSLSLMGRGCCGSHKLAIQEKYKEEKRNV